MTPPSRWNLWRERMTWRRDRRRVHRAFLRQMGTTPHRRHLISAGRVFIALSLGYAAVAALMTWAALTT